jgi:2-keto-4-pentenoate hydratase
MMETRYDREVALLEEDLDAGNITREEFYQYIKELHEDFPVEYEDEW